VVSGELALDERGKILGLRVDALHDMGSHVFDASMVVPLFALKLAPAFIRFRQSMPAAAPCSPIRRRCSPIAAPGGRKPLT
jgi:hypothetical protein